MFDRPKRRKNKELAPTALSIINATDGSEIEETQHNFR